MAEDFNRKHPELREGEVFLTNIHRHNSRVWSKLEWASKHAYNRISFDDIEWKTKRMGCNAYSSSGQPINDLVPVFVQRSELKAAGINLDKL